MPTTEACAVNMLSPSGREKSSRPVKEGSNMEGGLAQCHERTPKSHGSVEHKRVCACICLFLLSGKPSAWCSSNILHKTSGTGAWGCCLPGHAIKPPSTCQNLHCIQSGTTEKHSEPVLTDTHLGLHFGHTLVQGGLQRAVALNCGHARPHSLLPSLCCALWRACAQKRSVLACVKTAAVGCSAQHNRLVQVIALHIMNYVLSLYPSHKEHAHPHGLLHTYVYMYISCVCVCARTAAATGATLVTGRTIGLRIQAGGHAFPGKGQCILRQTNRAGRLMSQGFRL
eukprot:1160474-Pelagomonas_calceolata.AAC.3